MNTPFARRLLVASVVLSILHGGSDATPQEERKGSDPVRDWFRLAEKDARAIQNPEDRAVAWAAIAATYAGQKKGEDFARAIAAATETAGAMANPVPRARAEISILDAVAVGQDPAKLKEPLDRILAVIASINNVALETNANELLAFSLARAGAAEDAFAALRKIPVTFIRMRTLAKMVGLLGRAGSKTAAAAATNAVKKAIAEMDAGDVLRGTLERILVQSLAEAGKPRDAAFLASTMRDPELQAKAYADALQAFVAAGNRGAALELVPKSIDSAVELKLFKEEMLARNGALAAAAGEMYAAEKISALVAATDSPRALYWLAETRVLRGQLQPAVDALNKADKTAEPLFNESDRAEPRCRVVTALARAKSFKAALAFARNIKHEPLTPHRRSAYLEIGRELGRAGMSETYPTWVEELLEGLDQLYAALGAAQGYWELGQSKKTEK